MAKLIIDMNFNKIFTQFVRVDLIIRDEYQFCIAEIFAARFAN